MPIRHAVAALAGLSFMLSVPQVLAQTPTDFSQFTPACMAAQPFLLGEVPEGVKAEDVLTPLCGCLVKAFAPMSQKDVDVLTTDLKGESTEESHAAHGDYAALGEKAREGLNTCFASPEVSAAMKPAADNGTATPEPESTTPAAPATETPAAPAQ